MQQDQAAGNGTGPMIHVNVSGADTVTARMPTGAEQKSMGIGWVPILVIAREGGTTELYDATKYAALCVKSRQAEAEPIPAERS